MVCKAKFKKEEGKMILYLTCKADAIDLIPDTYFKKDAHGDPIKVQLDLEDESIAYCEGKCRFKPNGSETIKYCQNETRHKKE